ncbi:hypothetical protein [Ferruginibacter sp. HRS2-29]|uniref:ORC-CDC6 family AAA ATPase n=1 Tax=Ferruginibacter sp. HRS2-29 TaxID=2487334 RepID=UPI0020CF2950|nr:hypothetical protein [Ferruginibacter sp. HRS2-29]MCP9749495.1 hypothetical protein [Ferruginibacter sp. HRS2-29]
MSNRYRNPFKIRATEKLETENNFLKMYSPYILDELLEKNTDGKLWNNILFIRSSPGAGKTSILKIFEPYSLLTLSNNKSAAYYKEILDYLKKLDIIDNSGKIYLIGVYISCARNYEVIEDLDVSEGEKKNMFFALINSRVILSTLRSILNLYPTLTLDDISINASPFDYSFLDLQFPISGTELFSWAAEIERNVFRAIDSFLPIKNRINGHNELFAFSLMQPSNLFLQGNPYQGKVLFMFDDAHKLNKSQREFLIRYLTIQRSANNIWIAERLDAFDVERNLGSFIKRDYDEINLEEVWQGTNKFKTIVANIADKRAMMSSENVTSFQDFLEDHLKEINFEEKFISSFKKSEEKINSMVSLGPKFEQWIAYFNNYSQQLTSYDKLILAKQIEIIIARTIGKAQLAFDFPLIEEELKQKLGGEILSAAILFASIENKIPYYYGFENLVKLSSNNIEQFLSFAGDLYEIMLSRKISDKNISLDASEQEKLLRKIADSKWNEQIRLLPYSDIVLKFLNNLSVFFQKETYKPNAPYAPGVTGFSIKENKENKLIENEHWKEDKVFLPLVNVISTCLAYNILEKRITKQGKENQQWTIYYLNRWICLRYNLPFSYGGFRHRYPSELLKWTK